MNKILTVILLEQTLRSQTDGESELVHFHPALAWVLSLVHSSLHTGGLTLNVLLDTLRSIQGSKLLRYIADLLVHVFSLLRF